MKIVKNILLIACLTLIFACENYLDSVPYSFTAVDNFYQSQKDAELALTGCYSALVDAVIQGEGGRATFGAGSQLMLNGATDEVVTRDGFANPVNAPFGLLSYDPDNEQIRKNWFFYFAGINRTNYLLEKINSIEMSESRKSEIIGEAHFLRGLFYMYLGMMYGGVPVYTDSAQDPYAERQSLETVYAQIISDFQNAYERLPNRSGIQGRANKWSAAGFLAKVYTYLGSAKSSGAGSDLNFELNQFDWVDAEKMYSEALVVTRDIIDHSDYQLVDRYDNLFRETTADWQYQECLFTVESSDVQNSGTAYAVWGFWMVPVGNFNLYGGGSGWYRPVGEMYYRYDEIDFRRAHNVGGVYGLNSSKENIDGISYYIPQPFLGPQSTTFCVNKFRQKDPALKTITKSFSEGNYPLLRFADILLLHAEALYFNNNEVDARNMLTEIRERALIEGENVINLNTAYHKINFIEELLDERSRELCFESWRRIDLIRFNKYGETLNNLSEDVTFGRWNSIVPEIKKNWAPYKIWFPIPGSQVDINQNLIQNPGY